MRKLTILMSVLLTLGMFSACSKDDNNGEENTNYFTSGLYPAECFAPNFSLGDINVLFIQDENGKVDTCGLYGPYCGTAGPITTTGGDNITFEDYPMVFSSGMWYAQNFDELQLSIENRENKKIGDLKVGDSFSTSSLDPNNKISIKVWWEDVLTLELPYQNKDGALNGRIEVVDKKTVYDVINYITLSFQDLEFYAYDKDNVKHTYVLNGLAEFEICEAGSYKTPEQRHGFDESMRQPTDELDFFMMDALNGVESQGRRTFFSEGSEKQECLIINSEEEFQEAYKGDKELPRSGINFKYCSLVIGRTYGENSGVSLGGFKITDNGNTYQIDVTLNKSVNPNYSYTDAPTDLYYWNIYPKMEKKSVVFNRIYKNVNIDPINNAYARISSNRWILEKYTDADGKDHRVGSGYVGDKRYYIEFKEDGSFSGRIKDLNDFSGSYTLPFVGKRAYYQDIEHGVINMSDWKVTDVNDNDPVSKQFMRMSKATQFKPVWPYYLILYVSSKEYFMFRTAQ